MPILLNPQWERFSQELAKGKSDDAAYVAAGYKSNRGNANKLKQRECISLRVAEIQREKYEAARKVTEIAVKKAGLEESWIVENLMRAVELALNGEPELDEDGNPTGRYGKRNLKAAIDGLRLCSDIKGIRVQRHEVGQPGDFARMSDEELDTALAEQARALGLPEEAVGQLLELRAGSETVQ